MSVSDVGIVLSKYIQYVNDINKVKLKNEQKNRKEQHHKNEQKLDMGKYQVYNYPIYMTKATGARVVQSSNFFQGLCHRIFTERCSKDIVRICYPSQAKN